MPISPSFTTSQTIGQPSIIKLTDTSTGSDVTVVERRVYLVDALGEYVVPVGTTTDYVVWAIGNSTIDIDCLTKDMALNITVDWVNVSGTTVVTYTLLRGFTLYNETYYYSLTQAQASQSLPPSLIQDTNYYNNKMKLRVEIDNGNQAITYGGDIASSQECYDRASYLVANENFYF